MAMISDMVHYESHSVEGLFRLTRVFSSDNGTSLTAVLEDYSGTIQCRHWRYDSDSTRNNASNLFHCRLFIHKTYTGVEAELVSVKPVQHATNHALLLLPYSSLPSQNSVAVVDSLINQCPIVSLRQFINDVFSDDKFALNFFRLPASREHHHSYMGGLAEHSFEVASIIHQSLWQCSEDDRWLAIVAGLLHDAGKCRTFNNGGRYSNLGFVMQHDQLTLEILAKPLQQLDTRWPDGAIALRYLLTRSSQSDKRPLMPCSLAIEYADKMSSAQSAQQQAFNQKPEWQRFAKLDVKGPKSLFWRPAASKRIGNYIGSNNT